MHRLQRWFRATHQWLGLIVGLQLLIWAVSGFYMVAVRLDFIHGDFLVRSEPALLTSVTNFLPVATLAARYENLESVKLSALPGTDRHIYQLASGSDTVVIDAITGEQLNPLSQSMIEGIARWYYAGSGEVAGVTLIKELPVEVRGRSAPLWRVDFDDAFSTSLYFHRDTGALVTRRHRWWRVFDAFWMLHIMDYGYERDDVNNNLLRVTTVVTLVLTLSGAALVYYSFRRRRRSS